MVLIQWLMQVGSTAALQNGPQSSALMVWKPKAYLCVLDILLHSLVGALAFAVQPFCLASAWLECCVLYLVCLAARVSAIIDHHGWHLILRF